MGVSNLRIGFLVNPIAGMGGSAGLKGTDGDLFFEALKRGGKPIAPYRAFRFLKRLKELTDNLFLTTPPKCMGLDYVRTFFRSYHLLDINVGDTTSREDTLRVCEFMVREGVDLVVFVGGDGTARDVYSVIKTSIPMLGVPSGVKMYSGVFASSPEAAAEVVSLYVKGMADIELGEVADVDESYLSSDILKVRVYGIAKVPYVKELIIPSKDFSGSDDLDKEEVAEYVVSNIIKPNTLYILGPGTTLKAIADKLGVSKTLLGVDAVYNGVLVGKDLSEPEILELLRSYRYVKILVTPIGRQGFILGRGNQQISARVVRAVGKSNIIVVATRSKMAGLRFLRVDTGDVNLDKELEGYVRVIIGFNEELVARVVSFS